MYNNDEIRTYKPSGIFSPLGAVLLTLTTFIILSVLFIPYLWLVRVCPIVYVNVLLAILVSVAAGIVCGRIIKMYKMRNVTVTIVCVVIAFLGATYVKWAMYDYFDNTIVIKKAMQEYNAYEYYDFGSIFPVDEDLDSQIDAYLSTDEWEQYGYDKMLGESVSEVKSSLENAKVTDAYSFTYAPGKCEQETFFHIFAHPSNLWKDIVAINQVGRWKLGSDSYSDNVHGIFLWVTWLAEFALLGIVLLLIAIEKVRKPFIETDNEWAEEEKSSDLLKFAACSDNVDELRDILMTNQNRFFEQKYSFGETPQIYIGIKLFMSHDRNENYLSAYLYTYVEKNKNYNNKVIVKYAFCDRDLCLYLLNLLGKQ